MDRCILSFQSCSDQYRQAFRAFCCGNPRPTVNWPRFMVPRRVRRIVGAFPEPRSSGRQSAHSFSARSQSRLTSAATRFTVPVRLSISVVDTHKPPVSEKRIKRVPCIWITGPRRSSAIRSQVHGPAACQGGSILRFPAELDPQPPKIGFQLQVLGEEFLNVVAHPLDILPAEPNGSLDRMEPS